jgi:hypothetical protein
MARVFSRHRTREVAGIMLEMAVQPEGTAPKARVPGYRVGGKTGTAYKIEGGVYARKYVASFVGIAPISDPRLVVAVMIDEPTAAPTMAAMWPVPPSRNHGRCALRTLGMPPDAPIQVAEAGRKGAAVSAPRQILDRLAGLGVSCRRVLPTTAARSGRVISSWPIPAIWPMAAVISPTRWRVVP